MTDAKRGAMLLLLGLFTAVLLYPALHEGGHILVTLLLGGRIRDVYKRQSPRMPCFSSFQKVGSVPQRHTAESCSPHGEHLHPAAALTGALATGKPLHGGQGGRSPIATRTYL